MLPKSKKKKEKTAPPLHLWSGYSPVGGTKMSTCYDHMVHSSNPFPASNSIWFLKLPVRTMCSVCYLCPISVRYGFFTSCSSLLLSYLQWVEASYHSSVVHLAALGWMSKLALLVRPWASAPLELPAYFQCQPLCVSDMCYVHCHGNTQAKSIPSRDVFRRG